MSKFLDISGLSYFWSKLREVISGKADKTHGVYQVIGTQTVATSAWTGEIDVDELYDGLTIAYYLPMDSKSAYVTLELTLRDGTTTEAIYVFYNNVNITTNYQAGSTIMLTYWSAGSVSVDGTPTSAPRWCTSEWNTNTNTIGYYIRTDLTTKPLASAAYRYRLLFSSADDTKWVPANSSTSTNATAKRTPCQIPIDPFGPIVYYGTTKALAADGMPSQDYLWSQYYLAFGYSFNTTGAALALEFPAPVYVKCAPQPDGSAIIDETEPYVQALPTEADGFIYIFIGMSYSATQIELYHTKPVYCIDSSGHKRLWTGTFDIYKDADTTSYGGA